MNISRARFEGLTRIVVEMAQAPGPVKPEDIGIGNCLSAGGKSWAVCPSEILGVAVSGCEVIISLSGNALVGQNSAMCGKMAKDACVSVKGSECVPIMRQGAAIADVRDKILDPDTNFIPGDVNYGNSGRGTTYWLNMGNGHGNPYRTDHGTDPANWLNEGCRYSLVGMECNTLIIVFDFPDARGVDNTGIVGLPGDVAMDKNNYVNGKRLRTARNYYDWVSGRNIQFMDEASYGNVKTTWTLLENSEAGTDGIYSLPYSLYPSGYYEPGGVIYEADKAAGKPTEYPWLKTNPKDWGGYWFGRGGSIDNWVSGSVGYPAVPGLRRDFDALVAKMGGKSNFTMGYWAVVENAVGITYGASFGGNGTIGAVLGLDGPKDNPTGANGPALLNYSFMGGDSYNIYKYRHMTHELGHQMGLPDHYIEANYIDPYTGTRDGFFATGGFDHMGQITGISPDFFAWIKWKFGWFRDDQIVAITDNGDYNIELTPIETQGGTKLVIIPGETRGVLYCVEYRGGKLGVNNIEKTEMSNDPFDPDLSKYGEQARWNHDNFGTDTQAGILLYRINANVTAHDVGHTIVVDLMSRSLDNAEGYDKRFSETLNNSLLGPASGVYSHTDDSFGITISVDPSHDLVNGAGDKPYPITITKKTPTEAERRIVLSNAEFVDMNTIQFTTNVDLRGLHPANFRVTKDGAGMTGAARWFTSLRPTMLTSYAVRIALMGTPFTLEDLQGTSGSIVTVEVIPGETAGTLYQYLPSASAVVAPKPLPVGVVTLSNARFANPTTITAAADKDLSGFAAFERGRGSSATGVAKANLRITRPDGKMLAQDEILSAAYDRESGALTINIVPNAYRGIDDTVGTSVEIIGPVSSCSPQVTKPANPQTAQWYHDTELNKTDKKAFCGN
ncbi:MAG: hypothetical protein FWC93_01000 [Defluviitaleaceae bacterium]|nr:hypothetical protein [Defluviitaleaceae bacterium]